MINPVVNTAVLIIFGLLIGVVLQMFGLIMNLDAEKKTQSDTQRKQHGFLRRTIDAANQAADEGVMQAKSMPRSGRLASGTFFGLIAMFIVVLRYSPIRMRWWVFLGSVFAGFLITQWIFTLAKAGKVRVKN